MGVKVVKLEKLPACSFCALDGRTVVAKYDASTPHGWAFLCGRHFKQYGCVLGLGRGQKLVTK